MKRFLLHPLLLQVFFSLSIQISLHAIGKKMVSEEGLEDWTEVGNAPATWELQNGILTFTQTEKGRGWLRWGNQQWSHYRITLEWKAEAGGNSGIFIHMPSDPNADGTWDGIEIQICDDTNYPIFFHDNDPRELSGSVYGIVPPSKVVYKGTGSWNHFELTVRGPRIHLVYNEATVIDVNTADYPDRFEMWNATRNALSERPTSGYVGLQAHKGAQVWFRNLKFESLESTSQPSN